MSATEDLNANIRRAVREDRDARLGRTSVSTSVYLCRDCGHRAFSLAGARKHAKQGFKTQREAFQSGQLHTLDLTTE